MKVSVGMVLSVALLVKNVIQVFQLINHIVRIIVYGRGVVMCLALPRSGLLWKGTVTPGEDCDIASNATDNTGKIGCSFNCLHEGTPLSQAWCEQTGHEIFLSVKMPKLRVCVVIEL
jgi:hypothetical protein